jgi:hypothetical protein
MIDLLKIVLKQPYSVISLIIGSALVAMPFLTFDKDWHPVTHSAQSIGLVVIGSVILAVSIVGFGMAYWIKHRTDEDGLDLSSVKEIPNGFSIQLSGCEIRVVEDRIEQFAHSSGTAIALPCNEYFDDDCAKDSRSALGAYVDRFFGRQIEAFISLILNEAKKKFGDGAEQQKTEIKQGNSFGAGKCLLLLSPLGRPDPIALISTSTQRAGEGLKTEISCLFEGMHRLNECLADARITEVAMPILGAGHGGIYPPLALMSSLLAVAEAARYGRGSQRLKRVTLIVFKKDSHTPAEVDKTVIRRALALIGTQK